MQKKIFYLRTDLGTQNLTAGGSVAHTLGVINGFLSQGYELKIASSAMVQLLQEEFGCTELTLPRWTTWAGFKVQCLLSNLLFFLQTIRLCDASITFIYQRYSLLNCTGVLLSWWKSVPLVLEFNGSEVWADEHWAKNKTLRLRFLIRWFERLNVRYAHSIVVVSQPLKDLLIAQGISAHKILVNPNGVQAQEYDPALLIDERAEVRARLGFDDAYVFGFIGTFSHWHGINVLQAMIPEVVRRCPRAKFLLIGAGPLLDELKATLTTSQVPVQNVVYLGMVAQHEARKYLAACDAFLSPTQPNVDGSPFFGSPTKLFEYMSLAKPIIASDLGTIADIVCPAVCTASDDSKVIDNQLGILVAPDDIAGFINAACALVDFYSLEQCERMGNNARNRVLENFTWSAHVAKIMTFVGNR